jgi:PAS domain S-box-containing protein
MNKPNFEKLFHADLFNQIPLCIAIIDKDYNIFDANELFKTTYGKWKKKKCYEVYKRKKKKCSRCLAEQTFKDGKTRISEEQGKDKNGNINFYTVHYFPFKNEKGEIPYIVEMSSDITDRIKIKEEYQLLFNNVPCSIAIIDKNFQILKTNKYFDQTFEKKGAKYCYEFYKRKKKPCSKCPAKKVFKTKEMTTTLQKVIDKNGNELQYMTIKTPINFDDNNEVLEIMEIALDMSKIFELKTRLTKIEQEKLKVEKDIQTERLAAVGQTVAGLSHGLKNVLMGLEGGRYVVNSGLKRNDNNLVRDGWEMLEDNISRIASFVKDFLHFAKGKKAIVEPVDPVKIAQEIVLLFKDKAKQEGINLTQNFPDSIKKANMDPKGIHTALANLISNAIDACLLSDEKEHEIVFSCYEKNNIIYFTVKDNGCGMDYEVKKKVFTNFFTTKGSGQGTGLGLLETRKIVNQHGGKISVESQKDKGSEFSMEFNRKNLPKNKKK